MAEAAAEKDEGAPARPWFPFLENRVVVSRVLAAGLLLVWVLAVVAWALDFEQRPTLQFAKLDALNAPYLAFMRRWYGVNADSRTDFKYSLADLGCDVVDPNVQTDAVKKWVVGPTTARMRYERWPNTKYAVPQGYTRNMAGAVARGPASVNHRDTAKVDASPYHAWVNGLFVNTDPRNGTLGTVQLAEAFPVDFRLCFHVAANLEDFSTKVVFLLLGVFVLYAVSHLGKLGWLGAWYERYGLELRMKLLLTGAVPILLVGFLAYLGNYLFSDDYSTCNDKLGLSEMHGLYMANWVVMLLLLLFDIGSLSAILSQSPLFLHATTYGQLAQSGV